MESRSLYHGTSSFFAAEILRGTDASPLERLGALQCASELYPLLMELAGSIEQVALLYPENTGVAAPMALRNVHRANATSLISYGGFYASSERRIAARYAARNTYGSELLSFLDETIVILRQHKVAEADRIIGKYAGLLDIFTTGHYPVVLEMSGIPIDRLSGEDGSAFTVEKLESLDSLKALGVQISGAVRVAGPVRPHIVRAFSVTAMQCGSVSDEPTLNEISLSSLLSFIG